MNIEPRKNYVKLARSDNIPSETYTNINQIQTSERPGIKSSHPVFCSSQSDGHSLRELKTQSIFTEEYIFLTNQKQA